ncbi:MAG TPA: S8 family serine peptidase [Bryobacteraceae bacterium]|nr:S8 family serine peptidase [Bryobacteraceae bacterium]
MNMKHVILREVEHQRPGMLGAAAGGAAPSAPASPVAVEMEMMTPNRASEVARKQGVAAVAPVIPLRLIAPVELAAAQDPLTKGSTWGVKAVGADTSPFSGDGVIAAVLDTGIDATHPAFAGVNLIRRNFTTDPDEDQHGHGTHCAGTIFGRAVNGTRIGVAPGVKTAVIGKVLGKGGGGSDVLLTGIEWALQNGAHVISMSLGIDFPGLVASLQKQGMPVEMATSMALEAYRQNVLLFERLASMVQARAAFSQPCLLVAAAGNESRRDQNPDFQIAVSPPAAADGMVSVAALGPDPKGFTIAPFSNVGSRLSGPGVGVLSAKRGGGLTTMSGTSMATPHVAGVAALWAHKLRSANQFTARLYMDRLVGSGTMTGLKPGFEPNDIGAGMVRAPQD